MDSSPFWVRLETIRDPSLRVRCFFSPPLPLNGASFLRGAVVPSLRINKSMGLKSQI